jgi:hypothetical protein
MFHDSRQAPRGRPRLKSSVPNPPSRRTVRVRDRLRISGIAINLSWTPLIITKTPGASKAGEGVRAADRPPNIIIIIDIDYR